MASMNRVILAGNITRDPEIRFLDEDVHHAAGKAAGAEGEPVASQGKP